MKNKYILFSVLVVSSALAGLRAFAGISLEPKNDIAALTIEFMVNSIDLTPRSLMTLNSLGDAMASSTLKGCCFEIQGFADETGSDEYNRKLSEGRAESVISYLASHSAIEKEHMIARGYGKSHPIASDTKEVGRAKNRRVQIVNLGYGVTSTNLALGSGPRRAVEGQHPSSKLPDCRPLRQLIARGIMG